MPNPGPREVVQIISLAGGEIIGSTRLQKIGCLLDLVGAGVGFEFSYHIYGPYSEELSLAASDADALDLIDVNEKTATWGGRYSIYRVPTSGQQTLDANIMKLAKRASQADSVALELAVTAAFLAENGYDGAWDEVAERKQAKATPEMMAKAKALYRDFQKIKVPNALPAI
jgi:uncharacterized protein YwgA